MSITMMYGEFNRSLAQIVTCVFFLSFAFGCSGGSSDQQTPVFVPLESYQGFDSAEAVVEHFNSLTMKNPINHRGQCELIYSESELQKRLLQIEKSLIPVYELATTVREKFNKPLYSSNPDLFITLPHQKEAEIVERGADRAQADFVDAKGNRNVLYLVRVADQWWVSGRTLLYYDNESGEYEEEALSGWEQMSLFYYAFAPDLTRRVRTGEISSYEEFTDALALATLEH